MSLLQEIKQEYQDNLLIVSDHDKEITLNAINKAIKNSDKSCYVGGLIQIERVKNWLIGEGFTVEYNPNYRDGYYLIISGWAE